MRYAQSLSTVVTNKMSRLGMHVHVGYSGWRLVVCYIQVKINDKHINFVVS